MNLVKRFMVGMIRMYQIVISPYTGPACRYEPTCSEYTRKAIDLHGPLKGGWLGLRRILSCHPWGGHGYDPVPEPKAKKS